MRIALFRQDGGPHRLGVVEGDEIVDVSGWLGPMGCCPLASFIERTADSGPDLSGERFALSDVTWLPPMLGAATFLCVGLNYKGHIAEGSNLPDVAQPPPKAMEYPALFSRYWPSVVGHMQPIVRPRVSTQLDFEGELAVVIGKHCRAVPRRSALEVVAGYTIAQDGSVRDWQQRGLTWTAGKNFEASGSVGPWVVTADEVPDPAALHLTTTVSGEQMQASDTSLQIFDIPYLIEYVTAFMPLAPGDVIITGTPDGVGFARNPKRFLAPGDVVTVEISGIGRLENPVVDEKES